MAPVLFETRTAMTDTVWALVLFDEDEDFEAVLAVGKEADMRERERTWKPRAGRAEAALVLESARRNAPARWSNRDWDHHDMCDASGCRHGCCPCMGEPYCTPPKP